MKKVGFLYKKIFLKHENPAFHPENEGRLLAILEGIKNAGLYEKLIHLEPRKATEEEITRVHDKRYFERIKAPGEGYLDPDTYKSEHTFEAALYAAGASITAVEACKDGNIERSFCAVRPPGHHAERSAAMGFCIFNNVAVGARYAQKIGYEKVFIVDFDVHHGNGTQHIFEEDDTVFYFSTHQYPYYPGTGSEAEKGRGKGAGFTYNVPMRAGSGDDDYLRVYSGVLPKLISDFSPNIMFVSSGYDIHQRDPLAGMSVSTEGIRGIVRAILDSSGGIPVIFSLEGGYNHQALSESVAATIEEMLR
ncbi:MAG: histone deacetylase [Nitrospirae bacterium]|nr:MAG: histone deacetylase [Nitrospirota bacterium]